MALAVGCGTPDPTTPDLTDPPPAEEPPLIGANVLLVVLDDVGIDQVAPYAAHPDPIPLPNIEALAARGMLFERAWAHASCSPGRAALMTGRAARRTGIGEAAHFRKTDHSLQRREVTLAEVVRRSPIASYATVGVGKWHLAVHDPDDYLQDPLAQGFDTFSGTIENLTLGLLPGSSLGGTFFDWERNRDGVLEPIEAYAPTVTVDDALERLTGLPEPWLGYVSLHSGHSPYHVPPDGLFTVPVPPSPAARDLYRADVQAADTEIGRLLDGLDPDVLARTVVIVTSDNGSPDDAITAPLDPARGKLTLFEVGVRVPLIVAGPGVAAPGARSDAMVQLLDLLPTVAEIAGVDPTALTTDGGDPVTLDGRSLVPFLLDPAAPPVRELVYVEKFAPNGPPPYSTDLRAITDGEWKLMVDLHDPRDPSALLFHLTPGQLDEGLDLLADGITDEELATTERLGTAILELVEAMPYEGDLP